MRATIGREPFPTGKAGALMQPVRRTWWNGDKRCSARSNKS